MKLIMNPETKICQSCKQDFIIWPDDFGFYEKIKVPPPTWCPKCRAQRRAVFRNERVFYRRSCDLCKNSIIAIYPKNVPFPVYCNECWYSDKWNPLSYGKEYDFSKSFFEQNRALRLVVPRTATIGRNNIDSTFVNIGAENKRGYFLIESSTSEDSAYAYWIEDHCKECFDSAFLRKTEVSYETQEAEDSFRIFFSEEARQCQDSWFLKNCTNADGCFGCVNLKNKQYHIWNKPYSKEEFMLERQKIDTGSYAFIEMAKNQFREFMLKFPRKYSEITRSVNCSGNYISNSKNCKDSFFIEDGENLRYCMRVMYGVKDIMDCDTVGFPGNLCYESINTALGVSNMKFCMRCWTCRDSEYCDNCDNISNCFGSIGLRSKEYCILNRQYSKEEYISLKNKIVEQMNAMPYVDSLGRQYKYGEFFPNELSPFAYNETIAQEYFPLFETEAKEKNFSWRDIEKQDYSITVIPNQIPDNIKDVSDSITKGIIGCAHAKRCSHPCTGAFRIVSQELNFYKKIAVPLPRLCPNCRHYERQAKRNPMKLWNRQCMCGGNRGGAYQNQAKHEHGDNKCPNNFETSYAPERPEIVYCESCYNSEVA